MSFEEKDAEKPGNGADFVSRTRIGSVAAASFDRIRGICEGVDVPKKQFEGPRRLYPNKPLRRCQEWTAEAITALVRKGVLEE